MPLTQITGEGVGTTSTTATIAVGNTTITGAATYTTSLKSTTALATPAALSATQATAFASTVSGAAIMGFGTTNDVSLMNRAGTVVLGVGPNTTTVNMTGLLSVTGFGTHNFSAGGTGSNILAVRNTTAGTSMASEIYLGNDVSNLGAVLAFTSSTYTAAGAMPQAGFALRSFYAGGVSIGAENASGAIRFYSGGTTERARFETNGRIYFGGTSASALSNAFMSAFFSSASATGLELTDSANSSGMTFINFNVNGANAGSVSRVGVTSAVVYNTTSDQRLKTDHGLASDIARLRALIIHDFDWKSDGTIDRGLFAQEAHSLYPLAVTRGTDEVNDKGQLAKPWSVSYASFVPDLIVGWQQHDATIATLTIQNTALEARIAILEARLAQ